VVFFFFFNLLSRHLFKNLESRRKRKEKFLVHSRAPPQTPSEKEAIY